jgi:uncharacterized protein (TIRG00374 family)
MTECRQIQNPGFDELSRLAQWKTAWALGPNQLAAKLREVELSAFLLSFSLVGVSIFLGILRWQMVLSIQGLPLSLGRAGVISMVAQFFNSFLLGSSGGDLMRAYYAARETHHKKTEAVVTVAVDRLIGLFSMLLFACLMMPANLSIIRENSGMTVVALVILTMSLCCGVAVIVAFWGGVSRGMPRAREWLRRLPKGDMLEKSIDACRWFGKSPGFLVRVMIISMSLNLVCVWQIQALAWGLHMEIPSAVLYLVVPMIICISALPLTPSGLGIRENLYVHMLAVPPLLIDATKALSLSLLAYSVFLSWSLIGGIVYLCIREKEHLDEVAKDEAD